MSSEKRSMILKPFDNDVPPLNIKESRQSVWNNAFNVMVTHYSLFIFSEILFYIYCLYISYL